VRTNPDRMMAAQRKSSIISSPATKNASAVQLTEQVDRMGSVNILGVEVTVSTLEDVGQLVSRWAAGPLDAAGPRYVCATSVHGLIEAFRDPEFGSVLNGATLVVPDGMPLVWFGRIKGNWSMERVYGPSLMWRICALTAGLGTRHFLYGGRPRIAEELAARLTKEHAGLRVVGSYCPPFRPLTEDELDRVAEIINRSSAEIVWVGLSTPKQERWIASIRSRLRTRVLVSVGAAFDYHTGRLRSAPRWMQVTGLEWAFRLAQEPRRLWRRYAYNNPLFAVLALIQLLGLVSFSRDHSRPGAIQ
jgi:N-acetylglucosaminyldiphosphoundecaprenol N-acetyl-beta-D-mannosaminyltransferase